MTTPIFSQEEYCQSIGELCDRHDTFRRLFSFEKNSAKNNQLAIFTANNNHPAKVVAAACLLVAGQLINEALTDYPGTTAAEYSSLQQRDFTHIRARYQPEIQLKLQHIEALIQATGASYHQLTSVDRDLINWLFSDSLQMIDENTDLVACNPPGRLTLYSPFFLPTLAAVQAFTSIKAALAVFPPTKNSTAVNQQQGEENHA